MGRGSLDHEQESLSLGSPRKPPLTLPTQSPSAQAAGERYSLRGRDHIYAMNKDIKFVGLVVVGVLLSGLALMLIQEVIGAAGAPASKTPGG